LLNRSKLKAESPLEEGNAEEEVHNRKWEVEDFSTGCTREPRICFVKFLIDAVVLRV
jgi:hypothetical protein